MANKTESDSTEKMDNFVNNLLDLDYKKAGRFIVKGLIIAILFGAILMTSRSVATNSATWGAIQDDENLRKYEDGKIGYTEYVERDNEINKMQNYMNLQDLYVVNIARLFISLGLLYVTVGFIGFAADKELDEKFRTVSLLMAGLILLLMMFTTFFNNIAVNVN